MQAMNLLRVQWLEPLGAQVGSGCATQNHHQAHWPLAIPIANTVITRLNIVLRNSEFYTPYLQHS